MDYSLAQRKRNCRRHGLRIEEFVSNAPTPISRFDDPQQVMKKDLDRTKISAQLDNRSCSSVEPIAWCSVIAVLVAAFSFVGVICLCSFELFQAVSSGTTEGVFQLVWKVGALPNF